MVYCRALALIVLTLALSQPAYADEKARIPIVGTWKLTSFTLVELVTNKSSAPYGQHPVGYLQYSPGGHFLAVLQSGDPKRPVNVPYTDADRLDAYRSILAAYAGTYTLEGNKVVHHVVTSWRPEWNGTDQTRYFTMEGNNLTIKTAPFKIASGDAVAILAFERAE